MSKNLNDAIKKQVSQPLEAEICLTHEKGDPIWSKEIDFLTQKSIDRVLEFFIRSGRKIKIEAEGDVLSVVTKIITDIKSQTPDYMQQDISHMMDYLIDWIADYSEQSQIRFVSLSFELKQKNGGAV